MLTLIAETPNARMNGQHVGTRFLVPTDTPISGDECLDAVTRVHVSKLRARAYGEAHGANWIGVCDCVLLREKYYPDRHTLVLVGVETADLTEQDIYVVQLALHKRLDTLDKVADNLPEVDGEVVSTFKLNEWRDALARLITIQMLIGGPDRAEPPKPSFPFRLWQRVRRFFGR